MVLLLLSITLPTAKRTKLKHFRRYLKANLRLTITVVVEFRLLQFANHDDCAPLLQVGHHPIKAVAPDSDPIPNRIFISLFPSADCNTECGHLLATGCHPLFWIGPKPTRKCNCIHRSPPKVF